MAAQPTQEPLGCMNHCNVINMNANDKDVFRFSISVKPASVQTSALNEINSGLRPFKEFSFQFIQQRLTSKSIQHSCENGEVILYRDSILTVVLEF